MESLNYLLGIKKGRYEIFETAPKDTVELPKDNINEIMVDIGPVEPISIDEWIDERINNSRQR